MFAVSLLVAVPALAEDASSRADRWWADIAVLADDSTEGRGTGTRGYLRAAKHVERRFREIGLAPAGEKGGFRQQVALVEQSLDRAASHASLTGPDGRPRPVTLDKDMLVSIYAGVQHPASVDAPLAFIGYGLHLPAQGHDDFAGVDLKGKIAVVIAGGPADIAAPVKAASRAARVRMLARAGAVGVITVTPAEQIEIPWERQRLITTGPGMYLADPAMRDAPAGFLVANFDDRAAERLFLGSGHDFAQLAAIANASKPFPRVVMRTRLQASLKVRRRTLRSPNLIARLVGSDPALAGQHVVVSAHLDHVGISAPIAGDRIYNGAMDDASGVATILDIASQLKAGPRPRRSFLFVAFTGEEKGLLGSASFARKPTVAEGSIVADLNFDSVMPMWPLTSVLAQGDGESTLGDQARAVAPRHGLHLIADPRPNRFAFTRTDQFSFVRAGIPSLAFKFGFPPGSEAYRIEEAWRASRYHAPNDDIHQPGILRGEAIRLHDYIVSLAVEIANDPRRPAWLPGSVFATPEK